MLIRFRARNFRSLKDEQELSLVASSLKDSSEAVTPVKGLDLGIVRVAAIYGANASGKSNVVKALAYMSSAVQSSQRNWPPEGPIPREPFLLDPQSRLDPSSFEADLLIDRIRYHYGFTLNDREILEEWLDAYLTGTKPVRKQVWFKREGKAFTFGNKLEGDNPAIERLTRPNSLFISAAAQNNHQALLPIYKWFAEQLTYVPRDRVPLRQQAAKTCRDQRLKSAVLQMLRAADVGVVGMDVHEEDLLAPIPPEAIRLVEAFQSSEASTGAKRVVQEAQRVLEEASAGVRKVMAELKEVDGGAYAPAGKRAILSLIHRGPTAVGVALGEGDESDGTLAFLGLLGPVLRAIESGGILCVDELDASLHPLLALEVVRLFNDPKLNPRGAQIIFTTHETNILDKGALRRDQIWFTEKDSEGATHLYPLTDFKPRKNEDLERGYLQGRYGAVPFIGPTDFLLNHQDKAEH